MQTLLEHGGFMRQVLNGVLLCRHAPNRRDRRERKAVLREPRRGGLPFQVHT